MSLLFAIVYETPEIARAASEKIRTLARGQALALRDMVVVTRKADGEIHLDQSVDLIAGGALGGAFWGSLIGMIFLSPLAGAVGGAAAGALGGWMTDYGIDDGFIRDVAARVAPGKAAVFVLADDMTVEKVAAGLGEEHGELLYSSLTANVDAVLSAALAGALREVKATEPHL